MEGQNKKKGGISRQQLVKGLKIGTAGVVAGTLLAVTAGLAAPGIANGLAGSDVAATFLMLATSAAVICLFGVAGGGLAAYAMN
jgi:hypothetical protein